MLRFECRLEIDVEHIEINTKFFRRDIEKEDLRQLFDFYLTFNELELKN